MTRIFIEGLELDIDKELVNRITYAIDDLENLDTKATPFSKTIVIPGTAKNNILLGNIFDFNNSNFTIDSAPNVKYNFNAAKSAKCRIDVNGLQVIKGVFRLLEIVYDGNNVEYECSVFGELGGFIAKVGNLRLEDLDFSAYNQAWTNANIVNSWDNANSGTGIYYPLIDIGLVSNGAFGGTAKKDYEYKAFRPALHVREYLDKIITNAGYTWESAFCDTDFFKRLIIPHNSKALTAISSTALAISTVTNQYFQNPAINQKITYEINTTLGSFVESILVPGLYNYTGVAAIDGKIKFNAAGFFNNSLDGACRITVVAGSYNETYYFTWDGGNFIPFSINIEFNATVQPGQDVYVYFSGIDPNDNTYYVELNTSDLTFITVSPTPVPLNLNEAIIINDTIPRGIFQKDFFASILKMNYMLVTEDKFIDKHLIITPWVDFYDTTPSSYIDWSDKLDRGKQIRVKPMSEVNARYYELKYKSDTDFYLDGYKKKYNEGYGDRFYDNGLEFAKEKETVEVIFANSVLVGYTGEDKVVSTILKSSNNIEERIDHVIRIMQAKKVTGVTSWNIMDGATNLGSNINYPYAGHLDDPDAPDVDICFGTPKELFFALVSGNLSNNLFNIFYSSYMAEITDKDSRLLQGMVKLTESDIYNLDFSKFIYLDGGIYRLQKLIDYAAGENETTKVELLRAIYTIY